MALSKEQKNKPQHYCAEAYPLPIINQKNYFFALSQDLPLPLQHFSLQSFLHLDESFAQTVVPGLATGTDAFEVNEKAVKPTITKAATKFFIKVFC